MLENPKDEKTFVMIKPDGVSRHIIGDVISRIEKTGLEIVAIRMFQPTHEMMDNHYPKEEAWIKRIGERTLGSYEKFGYDAMKEIGTTDTLEIGKMVREWLINFMISSPVVKMVVKGPHAITMIRKMIGPAIPADAPVGTIRGDFSVDSAIAANKDKRAIYNLIHASETPEEAEHEIKHWFSDDEICHY